MKPIISILGLLTLSCLCAPALGQTQDDRSGSISVHLPSLSGQKVSVAALSPTKRLTIDYAEQQRTSSTYVRRSNGKLPGINYFGVPGFTGNQDPSPLGIQLDTDVIATGYLSVQVMDTGEFVKGLPALDQKSLSDGAYRGDVWSIVTGRGSCLDTLSIKPVVNADGLYLIEGTARTPICRQPARLGIHAADGTLIGAKLITIDASKYHSESKDYCRRLAWQALDEATTKINFSWDSPAWDGTVHWLLDDGRSVITEGATQMPCGVQR